ncbi:hypothetical protein [Lactococcus lactis]|uniref:hypothetical protein n=1 Tax=Lactococcus lactis TaxID=1358 RepID=UPI00071D9F71|nr:hypothetical protein [Lactococcus lactis]KSU12449.1 hypothetical protein LMG9446_1951 [Lactococcus lactis subsp. lactis]MCT0054825.1 hypothetical protein [Lactococcus lactis subsp. lactis]
MAQKLLIQAVAGAGKTHEIAKRLNLSEKNLILSFTNSNVANIKSEILSQHTKIPEHTKILTFSSFIYRWLIRPFEPSIILENKDNYFISSGVDIFKKPIENVNKYTPGYINDKKLNHYINSDNGKYYVSRMSKLLVKQPKKFLDKVLKNLSLFFDNIYIDEIQDFRGNDFKLLLQIYKKYSGNITGVGDFYQHSVQKSNFKEIYPFQSINKNYISLKDYHNLFGNDVEVIDNLLIKSRRIQECICIEIRKKLNINIFSEKKGGRYEVIKTPEKLEEIINTPTLVGLIWDSKVDNKFKRCNSWSRCKGDTYEDVCVVLTETLSNFIEDDFSCEYISQISINKLYVALTRARNNVYIVQKSVYDSL